MASTPRPDDELLAALESAELPEWTDPEDLSRMSVESFMAREHGRRQLRSHGGIRLAGDGVRDSSASLSGVGAIMQRLQRVVNSVGSALEGSRSVRGRISQAILNRTRLEIHAAPAPGSILIRFAPFMLPTDPQELGPDEPLFGDEPEPLADRSVAALIDLLRTAAVSGPDADEFASQLNQLGPRAASAVSDFAEAIVEDRFEMTLSWAEPEHPTEAVEVGPAGARWIREIIASRNLADAPVSMTGKLRTVSDLRAIEIETRDGNIVRIDRGDPPPPLLNELTIGEDVEVEANERVETGPGGSESRSYELLSIERANPSSSGQMPLR